jgi:TetR/AcrR family transcriptional regulator
VTLSNVRMISSDVTVIGVSQPRRSPRGPDRKRDPERTRERLVEAAVIEFGEHGYAGARISAIARRAGVNQQLISYYFDGKEGLFRALQERWRSISGEANSADRPLAEVVTEFLKLNVEFRSWARVLVWGGLTGDTPDDNPFFAGMVDDLRRRQAAGELAADLDPAYVMLLLFAAALAPTVVPQVARQLTGRSPDSPEFQEQYAAQLKLVIARLAGPRE